MEGEGGEGRGGTGGTGGEGWRTKQGGMSSELLWQHDMPVHGRRKLTQQGGPKQ